MAEKKQSRKPANKNEMAVVEVQPIAPQNTTPMTLIDKLLTAGGDLDVDKMTQLFELNLRYEENEAKKAFNAAFAAFKAEGIEIVKDSNVDYTSSKGRVQYDHASLAGICDQIVGAMSKHGLSHSWETKQEGDKVSVTCVLTHDLGHSKSVTLEAGADSSGGKNAIQAVGSAVTYLQRYTLLAVTGLATKAMGDDDGQGTEYEEAVPLITDSQIMDLEGLMNEVKANESQFLQYLTITLRRPVQSLGDIPAENFNLAVKALEAKRGK